VVVVGLFTTEQQKYLTEQHHEEQKKRAKTSEHLRVLTNKSLPMRFLLCLALLLYCGELASSSTASCDLSNFYSSIPELSDGKPTTRVGWESLLSKLHDLLASTHVTVPYTSSNTDVVGGEACFLLLLCCVVLCLCEPVCDDC
jgi:hypothetical protein